jgi:hypothetical protein
MSMWKEVALTVAEAAPIVGNLLQGAGTPESAGTGAVPSIVASALGTPANPDAVLAVLRTDPNAIAKVRQTELDNQSILTDIAMTREQLAAQAALFQAEAADRQSARAFAQATNDHTARNLAYLYTVALFLTISAHLAIWVLKVPIEPLEMSLISTLEGVLITMAVKTSEFFTGGSRSADQLATRFAQFATAPANAERHDRAAVSGAVPGADQRVGRAG